MEEIKKVEKKGILVKLAILGEKTEEFFMETTKEEVIVSKVLDRSDVDFEIEEYDLRVNGKEATLVSVLKDGDIITLIPNIDGGTN